MNNFEVEKNDKEIDVTNDFTNDATNEAKNNFTNDITNDYGTNDIDCDEIFWRCSAEDDI